jgi:hypothetical protein
MASLSTRLAASALALLAARADYVLQSSFLVPGCAGSPYITAATYGDVGFAPGGAGPGLGSPGCIPVSAGFFLKTTCANASYGTQSYYTSSSCRGAPIQSQAVSSFLSFGCTSSAGSSYSLTCASGAFAPGNSALTRSYSAPASCSNASLYAPSTVVAQPLGACVQMAGGALPQYSLATCNSTALTTSIFLGTACMGAPFSTSVAQLACTASPGSSGLPTPSIISCNSGAAASQSATMSVAPSAAPSLSVGASPSRTASPTPSRASVVQPMVLVTTSFDGAGCSPSAVSNVLTQPNACFPGASSGGASGGATSFTWTCVNASYATVTTFPNAACAAGGRDVTAPVAGVGKCTAGRNGNAVVSSIVSCAPGAFVQPALSAVITSYKASDTCTSLSAAPAQYITRALGCSPRLGGEFSALVSCNATAVSLTNFNGNSCTQPNGTGDVAYPLGVCLVGTGIGSGGPVKLACNNVAGATTSPAASHSPSPTPSLSVGSSPSTSPAAATPSPSQSLAFHPTLTIPAPPAGFREDAVWAPKDPSTGKELLGLEVPAGPHADIFCPHCGCDKCSLPPLYPASGCPPCSGLPPASVSLFMSALVFAEIPSTVDAGYVSATLRQMAWTAAGGLANLPARETANATVAQSGEWFSVSNVPCRTPSNPGGACALQIAVTYPNAQGGVGELPFRVWYKTFSNAALPAAAAAPSVAVPLGAGVGGAVGAVLLVCLLLHWARVLTVPCFNVCCDHHKSGVARARDRRSFGEVVTQNEAYSVQSYDAVLPQARNARKASNV